VAKVGHDAGLIALKRGFDLREVEL
jgi:hypothetical protein